VFFYEAFGSPVTAQQDFAEGTMTTRRHDKRCKEREHVCGSEHAMRLVSFNEHTLVALQLYRLAVSNFAQFSSWLGAIRIGVAESPLL
jgi:hypothetical protein